MNKLQRLAFSGPLFPGAGVVSVLVSLGAGILIAL